MMMIFFTQHAIIRYISANSCSGCNHYTHGQVTTADDNYQYLPTLQSFCNKNGTRIYYYDRNKKKKKKYETIYYANLTFRLCAYVYIYSNPQNDETWKMIIVRRLITIIFVYIYTKQNCNNIIYDGRVKSDSDETKNLKLFLLNNIVIRV